MRRNNNYKHRESIVFVLSLHLPFITTAKRPILKPGERGHLPTGTVTTNIKTTFTNTTSHIHMVPCDTKNRVQKKPMKKRQ
ncbi:hypothetical protein X798_01697 [Onchocerca flexuosa]|uniref:Secreted protein n=2 Tax=Onchocerca flexuosa TaxID=387005 RepID=A0A183I0A6_9BILA|nr:hypothetical protein X798_01697 [Onchocerca flexuosa]VDP13068.1 unnamed protein product [Onchocerca flexuosa]